MEYLHELVRKNGHQLVHYTNCKFNHEYESVFNYSSRHGGTVDGFKYYGEYVVDVTPRQKSNNEK